MSNTDRTVEFIREAAHCRPSARQLHTFRDIGFYAFIHFSPNTYTNLEWGYGNEDPAIFNPVELDCAGWVRSIKDAGMKGVVITAKHHDGFCLWQTKTTKHSMVSSPYKNGKGDIVRELSEAAAAEGIEFGFYLSPWDRNCELYGTDEYNDFYKTQLTELLTGYGKIFHVWFDGACGEGPNGKKQVYDFDGYIELIRKYQPGATIFNDHGPDIRWCGNESGSARYAEWAVVPSELCYRCEEIQTGPGPFAGNLDHMYNGDTDIGSLSNILYSKGLVFCPSEIDMSIRKGWFWHEDQDPHSLERLFDTYINSV
nr:alpha-L-fucosidase [Clostridia bacterium]